MELYKLDKHFDNAQKLINTKIRVFLNKNVSTKMKSIIVIPLQLKIIHFQNIGSGYIPLIYNFFSTKSELV